MTTTTISEAYTACQEITRSEARNFYYGIRLLPPPKRDALCALYALARRIDDIGDGDLPLARKRTELELVRKRLGSIGDVDDPVYVAVAETARRYPVPLDAFEEIVDGVELDLEPVRIADVDELVRYCRLVAGSVGRLCLSVFGSDGTDHGTAGPVFLLGRGVRGGFHGAEPGLTDLDDGDLRFTTDFRSVYASVLDGVLGADPARVLDGWSQPLDGLLAQ